MTRYTIRHLTTFNYEVPIAESVMELRMRPATQGAQRCLHFDVAIDPTARVFAYQDSRGNWVHHFDVPQRHHRLAIAAESQVEVDLPSAVPMALAPESWDEVDRWAAAEEDWDFRQPSAFTPWSDRLVAFADSLGSTGQRGGDPLTTVRQILHAIHSGLVYAPKSTRVDSPIDEALEARRGVCQDFSHIMLAMLRRLGLACRYVSGYIAPGGLEVGADRTAMASHAWIEVRLPELGWVGFDPTHAVEAGMRHVRVGIGRDYGDVPPTRGVFKGRSASTLEIAVDIVAGAAQMIIEPPVIIVAQPPEIPGAAASERQRQQQQ